MKIPDPLKWSIQGAAIGILFCAFLIPCMMLLFKYVGFMACLILDFCK